MKKEPLNIKESCGSEEMQYKRDTSKLLGPLKRGNSKEAAKRVTQQTQQKIEKRTLIDLPINLRPNNLLFSEELLEIVYKNLLRHRGSFEALLKAVLEVELKGLTLGQGFERFCIKRTPVRPEEGPEEPLGLVGVDVGRGLDLSGQKDRIFDSARHGETKLLKKLAEFSLAQILAFSLENMCQVNFVEKAFEASIKKAKELINAANLGVPKKPVSVIEEKEALERVQPGEPPHPRTDLTEEALAGSDELLLLFSELGVEPLVREHLVKFEAFFCVLVE